MLRSVVMIGLAVVLFCPFAPAFEPTSAYTKQQIEGFTIYVHPSVKQHPKEAKAAFQELAEQLQKIKLVVPAKAYASLQKIPFWFEWEVKPRGAAEYHVSSNWLKEHDYNPEKVRCVEINNTRNFVLWSQRDQPWMVLHELAHSYHHTVLGEHHAGLAAAYKQAMERRLYDKVLDCRGNTRKAYAATNVSEYFAELSEAYFGRNDFQPFTRTELKTHDPVGYALVQEVWAK
jgi:hypothetical protein